MRSGKPLLGGAAAALGPRLRRALAGRRRVPAPPPTPEPDVDEPPELPEEEVHGLREDLRRELARLASADIKASRTRSEPAPPPG